MTYSTHDLAVSVAMHFFKDPDYLDRLEDAHLNARELVAEWAEQGIVASLLAETFDRILERRYGSGLSRVPAGDPGVLGGESPKIQEDPAVQNARSALCEEFRKHGVEFKDLHPVIRRALLCEAVVFRRIERIVEMFFETQSTIEQKRGTKAQKEQMLVDVWERRGKLFDEFPIQG